MENINKEWYSKIPIDYLLTLDSRKIDGYLVSLEGWRRGFTLTYKLSDLSYEKFHVKGYCYTLEKFDKKVNFVGSNILDFQKKELNFENDDSSVNGLVKYRLYVVNRKCVGAIKITLPKLQGDSKSTIRELIEIQNEHRLKNPTFKEKIIKLDENFKKHIFTYGLSLEDILEKDKVIEIPYMNTLEKGADTESIPLTEIDFYYKDIIQKEIDNEIYNLDIIEKNKYKIQPMEEIKEIMLPLKGKPVNLAKEIINTLFNECEKTINYPPIYFDYNSVTEPLQNQSNESVKLKIENKKFMIQKRILYKDIKYRLQDIIWMKNRALELEFQGRLKVDKNTLEIILYGEREKVNSFIKELDKLIHFKYINYYINEYPFLIESGFQITNERNMINQDLEYIENQMKKAISKREILQHTLLKLENSKRWKIIKPLRRIVKRIKSII